MKINEVNPNPKLNEAGEIVQQMYQRKNKIMSWPSNEKPTIQGLVKELNDPLLTFLTSKDLDFFIHYGQAWLDLNPNNIWDDKSEMPVVNDMLEDPVYFATKKSTVFEIVKMHPKMYGFYAKQGFNSSHPSFTPETNLIQKYALNILNGEKFPLPYLRYILTKDGVDFGQEGRHRAIVADMLGATLMPCIIIAGISPPTNDSAKLREFSGKIFDQFE